jgi:hypothetical protein
VSYVPEREGLRCPFRDGSWLWRRLLGGSRDRSIAPRLTASKSSIILQRQASAPTVKQHMAAIRMLFSWLTEKGVLATNPAREVKTERFSRTEG